jgi:hypothetical protein
MGKESEIQSQEFAYVLAATHARLRVRLRSLDDTGLKSLHITALFYSISCLFHVLAHQPAHHLASTAAAFDSCFPYSGKAAALPSVATIRPYNIEVETIDKRAVASSSDDDTVPPNPRKDSTMTAQKAKITRQSLRQSLQEQHAAMLDSGQYNGKYMKDINFLEDILADNDEHGILNNSNGSSPF